MKSIGVKCAFDRHRLFRAFDFDFNNTVEYTEFIWGIAMLYDGSMAQKFDKLWRVVDNDNSGTLNKQEVFHMLFDGGNVKDAVVIDAMVNRIFQRLDQDLSSTLDHE